MNERGMVSTRPVRPIDPRVAGLLRCPTCKAILNQGPEQLACADPACGNIYPVVSGVPILIDETRSVFRTLECVKGIDTYYPRKRFARWNSVARRLLPGLSTNLTASRMFAQLRDLLRRSDNEGAVLVVGGGVSGHGSRELLNDRSLLCIETDVTIGPRTAIVCDAHSLPFSDGVFSAVVAQAVLEHVLDPHRCVDELWRVLKDRGLCYVETPFMQQVHGGRYDFCRFSDLGHRRLLRAFEEIERGVCCGPGMALAWAYVYFLRSLAGNRILRGALTAFGQCTAFWLKYLDPFVSRRPGAYDAASGFFFLGRKTMNPLPDGELLASYRGIG